MEVYYCIDKIRDKNKQIIGYTIINNYCKVLTIKAENLKQAIRTQTIAVKNLRLTIDNRIINGESKTNIDDYLSYSYKAKAIGINDCYRLDIAENRVWLLRFNNRASGVYTIERFVTDVGEEVKASRRIIGPFSNISGSIKVINKSKQLVNMRGLFGFSGIECVDLSEFDWSNARSLREFFFYCGSLKNIIMPLYSTHEVIDMASMFYKCESLEHIDLSRLDTENVTITENMFGYCINLKEINIRKFNTDKLST